MSTPLELSSLGTSKEQTPDYLVDWYKPNLEFRLLEEAVVKQRLLQIDLLTWNLQNIKRPQYLGHEQFTLHPCHLTAKACTCA